MREIDGVQVAVNILHGHFAKDFARMDFLFTHRHRSHRTVINVLRSLPGILMRVSDEHSPDIAFESTWVANPQDRKDAEVQQGGWQDVATTSWRVKYSYMAHTFMNIRKAREVAVFDYGFEIRSAEKYELMAIKSVAWKDPSLNYLQSIVGQEFKGVRLGEGVDDELKAAWRHPVVIEKERRIAEKQREFVSLGQSSRQLLVDVEDV